MRILNREGGGKYGIHGTSVENDFNFLYMFSFSQILQKLIKTSPHSFSMLNYSKVRILALQVNEVLVP